MKRKKTKERSWWQGGKKEDETQRDTQGYRNEGMRRGRREYRHRGLLAHCFNFRTLHAGYNTGCRIASAVKAANWSSKNSRIPYILETFLFYRKGGGEKKALLPNSLGATKPMGHMVFPGTHCPFLLLECSLGKD